MKMILLKKIKNNKSSHGKTRPSQINHELVEYCQTINSRNFNK